MRSRRYYAVCILWVFLLAVTSLCLSFGDVQAASQTSAKLSITSEECVVDVVNNGSNQALQASSEECAVVLPNLLTVVVGGTNSPARPILPFAGLTVTGQVSVSPKNNIALPWEPLTSESEIGIINQPAMRMIAVVTGLSATLVATVIGLDVALLELRLTKFVMRWAATRNPVRLIKR